MTNTINNANINGLLNTGNNSNNINRINPLSATAHSNHNRHQYRNINSSGNLENLSALFEPPVPINFNNSGSSSSSSSYWPASGSTQMNDEPQSETTAERLEHNSHKFHKTPYRDDNCKNEWLIEILGPTNILSSSSPSSNIPLNETANANLLNPKSPTTSLANRSNARLPNRNNTSLNNQSASNLNSVGNPSSVNQNVSYNSSQSVRTSTSSLNNHNKLNSHFPVTTSNNGTTVTNIKKNTSPPVVPGHVKPHNKSLMHHSASASTLHVQKFPVQQNRTSNDLLKVFKQMQLKPFINRLDDTPVLMSAHIVNDTNITTAPMLEPVREKSVNNKSTVSFDLLLSEDDNDDSFNSVPTPKTYKQPLSSFGKNHHNNSELSCSSHNSLKNVEKKHALISNDKASNNLSSNVYLRQNSANNIDNKSLNSNLIRTSASRTPTPPTVGSVCTQKTSTTPITETLNENQMPENDKTVKTSSLNDSSSSSSSDDEDSDSSSSSSSSSNGSSSSSDSDDDSSSSSSSSSSEGECSSSCNESDTSKPNLNSANALKKSKLTSKKTVDNISPGLSSAQIPAKIPPATIRPPHPYSHQQQPHQHHHRLPKVQNNIETDNKTLVQKLSNVASNSKNYQLAQVNLKKEDLSLTTTVEPVVTFAKEETSINKLDDGEISDNEADDENTNNDDDDSHNLTLTEMIEKIVSPNKKTTSSSSSSSSKNTSPQLPIFSSVASDSAQLVPKAAYSLELQKLPEKIHLVNSVNPSPYLDNMEENPNEETNGKITFTLSDDEIGEDSNASNQNMQNVLTFQQGEDKSNSRTSETPSFLNLDKSETVSGMSDDATECFQSFTKSNAEVDLKNSSETLFNKAVNDDDGACKANSGEKTKEACSFKSENLSIDNSIKTKTKSSIKIVKRESNTSPNEAVNEATLATSNNTKLAVTGENFKQPKICNISSLKDVKSSLSPNQQTQNGPLSAGFEPSKNFLNELNPSPSSFKDKPITPPITTNSPIKQQKSPIVDQKCFINNNKSLKQSESAPIKNILKPENVTKEGNKEPKSKRLISDSSSSEDEESNDDEFKAELGQYLKKKRPLDSGNDPFSFSRPSENDLLDNKTLSKSLTPSVNKHNKTGSSSIVTPTLTTAPTTPALIETASTPNPKPLKSQHGTSKLQGLANGVNKTSKIDEYDALNELIMRKGNDELDKELDLFNKITEKTNSLMYNNAPNNLKDTSPYNQLLVNHAQIHKNGYNENQFKHHASSNTASNPSITGDQIQYTADGRPKLIVSIELDLIKILNTQFGMQPLNDPYMDTDHQQEINDHDLVSKKRHNSKQLKEAESDTDDLLAKERSGWKGRDQQGKSVKINSSESRKSMVELKQTSEQLQKSSTSKESKRSSEALGNTSLSIKRSGDDFERNQRNITKKPKTADSGKVQTGSPGPGLDSTTAATAAAATLKMKNKTASFSNMTAAGRSLQSASDSGKGAGGLTGGNTSKSKSQSNMLAVGAGEEGKKRSANNSDKYGLFTLDFSSLEEQELHRRGKQKKHEADQEKDKYKKSIAYMEAVCYFCLCAISQYRLKKAAVNLSSNKSSFDLLNDTYLLLKYMQEKVLKSIDNDVFIKKFKVLSSWMETFINRWLWLMSLNDIRKLKESISKQQSLILASSSLSHSTTNSYVSKSAENNPKTVLTSPNELPPPSPASSVGSSAGSLTGNNNNNNPNTNVNSNNSSVDNASQQQVQFEIMQKTISLYERYTKLNEFNFRSQNFWDSNELQINEIDYLNEFRETIKKQVQKELHIDCEAELFASYIITGLQLFKLNF